MNWYTIQFKNGEFADGQANWDGVCLEDLLVELGLKASDAKRIHRVSVDRRPYQTFADTLAGEKAAA